MLHGDDLASWDSRGRVPGAVRAGPKEPVSRADLDGRRLRFQDAAESMSDESAQVSAMALDERWSQNRRCNKVSVRNARPDRPPRKAELAPNNAENGNDGRDIGCSLLDFSSQSAPAIMHECETNTCSVYWCQ